MPQELERPTLFKFRYYASCILHDVADSLELEAPLTTRHGQAFKTRALKVMKGRRVLGQIPKSSMYTQSILSFLRALSLRVRNLHGVLYVFGGSSGPKPSQKSELKALINQPHHTHTLNPKHHTDTPLNPKP